MFGPKILFSIEKRTFVDYFWLNYVRKDIFNRNFIRARFSFSLYLRNANWWEPGSGTFWKLRMLWVWRWPPIVRQIGEFFSIVPRRRKVGKILQFPSFLAFCGPINYFFCIYKAIFEFFSQFLHKKHVLFFIARGF